ncbi:MAG: putative surfeit locus 1 protein [Rhizobacter sp.]|nr:putative surfeit locus 1 protein [Rhizobacter sp.]
MGMDMAVQRPLSSGAVDVADAGEHRPRSRLALIAITVFALLAFAGFIALGTWQVERRAWKLDLIDRVQARVHAPAVAAPGPDAWPSVSAAADAYRHVQATGTLLHDQETLVQAATERGAGFWVLTPLRGADGSVVLVNQGFVPPERRDRSTRSASQTSGTTTVTGLLRISEPGGAFLRHNDANADRWYSRDVQAIAAARGLTHAAPYFIDAEAAPAASPDAPVGGLTVVAFHNNHLVYALTWYGLALMVAGAAWQVVRTERRQRRRGPANPGGECGRATST